MATKQPRDADNDGFVYDGTKRQRPAPPKAPVERKFSTDSRPWASVFPKVWDHPEYQSILQRAHKAYVQRSGLPSVPKTKTAAQRLVKDYLYEAMQEARTGSDFQALGDMMRDLTRKNGNGIDWTSYYAADQWDAIMDRARKYGFVEQTRARKGR